METTRTKQDTSHALLQAVDEAAVLAAVDSAGPPAALEVLLAEVADRCEPVVGMTPLLVAYQVTFAGAEYQAALHIGPLGVAPVPLGSAPAVVVRTDMVALHRALFPTTGMTPADDGRTGNPLARLGEVSGDTAAVSAYQACFPTDPDLTELCLRHGSDKWGFHWYTQHYERHFTPLRHRHVRVLEIGVGGHADPCSGGASLQMWKRFFPRGVIYGIDVFDKSPLDQWRVRTFQGHQADPRFLESVLAQTGELDIVIDDGSHINRDVLASFKHLFPKLRHGGLYVIEDLQTSYWPGYGGSSHDLCRPDTTVGFLKTLVDGLNYEEFLRPDRRPSYTDRHIVAMHLYHNLVVIEKGENAEGTFPADRLRIPTVDLPVPQ
ncbi:MAG TPA: class I SAM-dependent methyltransferase [Micromonosporaceae bacterium]